MWVHRAGETLETLYEKEKRGADDTDEAQRKTTHKKRKSNIRSGVKY